MFYDNCPGMSSREYSLTPIFNDSLMPTGYFTTLMNIQSRQKQLILASTSVYRQALLARLCLPFTTHAPQVDENQLPGEGAAQLAQRLAKAKAEDVSRLFPDAVVIGSDQVAEFGGSIIGKPGSEEIAVAQLLQFSGQSVNFLTAVAVICNVSDFNQSFMDITSVSFRDLDEDEVRRYIALDQPLDCAGSFKSEAAGPVLMQSICTDDPTAIIGLPLITLARMLRSAGFKLP